MKANELRIGNLLISEPVEVHWKDGIADIISKASLLKVCEIKEDGFTTTVIDRNKFPLPDGWQASPIPLTEEWLLKLGFKSIRFSEHWPTYRGKERGYEIEGKLGGYFVYEDEASKELYYSHLNLEDDWCERVTDEIKYVHQLQNLYFALVGEELKVRQPA